MGVFAGKYVPFLWFAAAGLSVWVVISLMERRRAREMRALVTGNLRWMGDALPDDFPLKSVGAVAPWYIMGELDRVRNVVAGPLGEDLLLVFDVSFGYRGGGQTTVVARRSTRVRPLPLGHPAYLLTERRNWRIVARRPTYWNRNELLHTETIELLWKALE